MVSNWRFSNVCPNCSIEIFCACPTIKYLRQQTPIGRKNRPRLQLVKNPTIRKMNFWKCCEIPFSLIASFLLILFQRKMLSRTIFVFFNILNMVCCKESGTTSLSEQRQQDIGCQHRSTSGRDYKGTANTTRYGIPCQRWSDTQQHDHPFAHVGDHNFCRNPVGSYGQPWCFTAEPDRRVQYCSVPFCPPLIALDFSLDNDWKPDENKS